MSYWSPRYWARRYWSPRYWPAGAVIVPVAHKKGHYPTLIRLIREEEQEKVVATSLMSDLIKRYGPVEGAQVYFKMERERKGPFQEGAKYGDVRLGAANPQAAKSGEQMIVEALRVRMKMAAKRPAKKKH